jgi:hypothetical protein
VPADGQTRRRNGSGGAVHSCGQAAPCRNPPRTRELPRIMFVACYESTPGVDCFSASAVVLGADGPVHSPCPTAAACPSFSWSCIAAIPVRRTVAALWEVGGFITGSECAGDGVERRGPQ